MPLSAFLEFVHEDSRRRKQCCGAEAGGAVNKLPSEAGVLIMKDFKKFSRGKFTIALMHVR
jgi:hypothetical protein